MGTVSAITVLVVDDSKRMRDTLRQILAAVSGCRVVGEASNGLEGLRLARTLNPSLVLMDVNMPRMDGLEALRIMKSQMPSVRVVMVTTALESDTRDEALGAGADACLEKGPDLWSELASTISDLGLAGDAG